jgi:hypothetical protein
MREGFAVLVKLNRPTKMCLNETYNNNNNNNNNNGLSAHVHCYFFTTTGSIVAQFDILGCSGL